jgi:carbon monoxide dehydrogenase subunit G
MAYEVEVPVRHRTLWLAFTDPEKMARAVPGLTVDAVQAVDAADAPEGVSGDVVAGRLKLRVGAGTITYRGTALIAAAEAQAGTLDIAVDVAQARGNGSLAGYLRIALTPSGDKTTVSVVPELELSGRALDFRSGELAEAASLLAGQWLTALADEYLEAEAEAEAAAEGEAEPVGEPAAVVEAEPMAEAAAVAVAEAEPVAESEAESVVVEAGPVSEPAGVEAEPAAEAETTEPVVESAAESAPGSAVESAARQRNPASSTPEPLLDDSLSGDPLEPVWRGEFEKSPWLPALGVLAAVLLFRRGRRRRRRKRETRGLTS